MTDRIAEYLKGVRADIAKYGHVVQAVYGERLAHFYTIGLLPVLGFELFVIGLPADAAKNILNDLAKRLKVSTVADGEDIHKIATLPLRLRTITDIDAVRPHVTMAGQLQPDLTLAVRQLLWPDRAGHFPGDPAYDSPITQDLAQLNAGPLPPAAPLTLGQFKASANHCADLSKHEDAEIREAYCVEDFPDGVPAGFVYDCGLIIEDHRKAPIEGRDYYLLIGNAEWLSNDLAELEELLYQFYLSEHGTTECDPGQSTH